MRKYQSDLAERKSRMCPARYVFGEGCHTIDCNGKCDQLGYDDVPEGKFINNLVKRPDRKGYLV